MSVAQLSARELGVFVAVATKLELVDFKTGLSFAELVSIGNCAAWAATYKDRIAPVTHDEIELAALTAINDESQMLSHFGPLVYNMIANNGSESASKLIMEKLSDVEKRCQKWQEGKRDQQKRKDENAVAFNRVGQLKTKPQNEIATDCLNKGFARVIVAEFMVNESCPYTDYHGGRNSRSVVIGYGKGKRESFPQLRKAAGKFKPTEHLGPKKGQFTCDVVYSEKVLIHGRWNYEGARCVGFDDIGNGKEFSTESEALDFLKNAEDPGSMTIDDGKTTVLRWELRGSTKAIENRENYSMGGGNYLGNSRYGGWKVSSYPAEYWTSSNHTIEFSEFEATPASRKRKTTEKQKRKSFPIAAMKFSN